MSVKISGVAGKELLEEKKWIKMLTELKEKKSQKDWMSLEAECFGHWMSKNRKNTFNGIN